MKRVPRCSEPVRKLLLVLSGITIISYGWPAVAGGQLLYATRYSDPGLVSVVDTASGTVAATVKVDSLSTQIALTPDRKKGYVANQTGGSARGTISVIDLTTNLVSATVSVGGEPVALAVTPDGRLVYNARRIANVAVLDTGTDTVTATVDVGVEPQFVAITPDGRKAYVVNQTSGNVSVIDVATNVVTTTISIGRSGSAGRMAITPDGGKAYVVSNAPDNFVAVIDTITDTVTRIVPVQSSGTPAVSPDGSKLYVAQESVLQVLDTGSDTLVNRIEGPFVGGALVFTLDGQFIYLAVTSGLAVLSTATNAFVSTINLGYTPFWLAGDPVAPPAPTRVQIDIKPGSFPNSINLSAAGVVPVAILSSDTFDATQVDPASVSLAGAKVKLIGKGDKYACAATDVNGDGRLDLVCHVTTAQFMIQPGDSIAVLEATTFGGQAVRGEDSIRIVPD